MSKSIENINWTSQLAKELHQPVRRKFEKRRVFTSGVDSIWCVDIADLSKFSRSNDGYKYLLMVIDSFSKFAWIEALK